MSRGDSRLSSNSFSETAHPLQGEMGAGGRGDESIPSSARLSCPFVPACTLGIGPCFVKGLKKITDI